MCTWISLWLVVASLPLPDSPVPTATSAQIGGLQRAAAAYESTLDIYRLGLLEWVPAIRLIMAVALENVEQGDQKPLQIPEVAHEVLMRLHQNIRSRVPKAMLPALGRGYHAEVLDALARLSVAEKIQEIHEPVVALHRAIKGVAGVGESFVRLFSHSPPIEANLIDTESLYADINNALDELSAAEVNVQSVRRLMANQEDIALAYRRTEIALGHLLDIWAVARRLGVDLMSAEGAPLIDFQLTQTLSTTSLRAILKQVHGYNAELLKASTLMGQRPKAPVVHTATMIATDMTTDNGARVTLKWTLPKEVHHVHLQRLDDRDAIVARVAQSLRCQGMTHVEANAQAQQAIAALPEDPVLLTLPLGATSYGETLEHIDIAPPIYELYSMSVFGVKSSVVTIRPLYLPGVLRVATDIEVHKIPTSPYQRRHYLDVDGVTIRWSLPVHDVVGHPQLAKHATQFLLPTVKGYLIEESSGAARILHRVKAGVDHLVLHPRAHDAALGVTFRVITIDNEGVLLTGQNHCTASKPLVVNLQRGMALGAAGAAMLVHPTQFERDSDLKLHDPALFSHALKRFATLSATAQQDMRKRWWHTHTAAQRIQWLNAWPSLFSAQHPFSWDGNVGHRYQNIFKAATLIEMHPELTSEVSRWWALLGRQKQHDLQTRWALQQSPSHQQWLSTHHKAPEAFAPLRLETWWLARDTIEQKRLDDWWHTVEPKVRRKHFTRWLQTQAPSFRALVYWPKWHQRTKAAQEQLLNSPPHLLPQPLLRKLYAFYLWNTLPKETLIEHIAKEVGIVKSTFASLRYALRPIDRATGFRLWFIVVMAMLVCANFVCVMKALLYRPEKE